LLVKPVVGQPFPTCYWLSDTALCSFIGNLEASGLIKQLEDAVVNGELDISSLIKDNVTCIRRRLSLLTASSASALAAAGGSQAAVVLFSRGIGGICDFSRVRCLHVHIAMHIAEPGGTAIGRYLESKHAALSDLLPVKHARSVV